jgi:hypothetical protein
LAVSHRWISGHKKNRSAVFVGLTKSESQKRRRPVRAGHLLE